MIEIVQEGNPVLRKVAKEVSLNDIRTSKIQNVIANMNEALASQEDGVAIAAPQIGVSLRIFIVSGKIIHNKNGNETKNKVFINPVITKLSKKQESLEEGCLSVRWQYGNILRSKSATVEALDEHGRKFTLNASGLIAQAFQHEVDHLNGILFIDNAKDIRHSTTPRKHS